MVAAPPQAAWAVLTDYERLPAFLPAMRVSRVQEREGAFLLLEQESVGRALLLRHTVKVLLEVREERPRRISFRDVARKCFESYEGEWLVEAFDGGARVRYRVEVREGPELPLFVPKRAVRRAAQGLLDAVAGEIVRRGPAPMRGARHIVYDETLSASKEE